MFLLTRFYVYCKIAALLKRIFNQLWRIQMATKKEIIEKTLNFGKKVKK